MRFLKSVFCVALAVFFFAAGIAHFTMTDAFATIVPPALPFPHLIVRVTGVMEIGFAAGLVWPEMRRPVGIGLALYLLAVLPANIYMAIADIPVAGRSLPQIVLWGRVLMQFPLIALILWATSPPPVRPA